MPAGHNKLIAEVAKANANIVVVLMNGAAVSMPWKNDVTAIVEAYLGGQAGGGAIADVLTGKVNPSGKLTMTFPVNYTDHASAKNFPGVPADNPKDVTYQEGIYVGYRYFNTFNVKPSYEFGYGSSYTTFDYSDVKVSSPNFKDKLTVSVTVKNTGKVAGKEVVQLYLSAPSKTIDKPKEELKAFGKTKELKPGESETLTLNLSPKDLASFIESKSAWIAEAGKYNVLVGASSLDIKQTASFTVASEITAEKVKKAFAADSKFTELIEVIIENFSFSRK